MFLIQGLEKDSTICVDQEILPTFLEQSFPRIPKNSPDCFSATYNCFYLPRLYYESNRDRIAEQSPMEVLGVQN